jgi:hypothetical protein
MRIGRREENVSGKVRTKSVVSAEGSKAKGTVLILFSGTPSCVRAFLLQPELTRIISAN